MTYKPNDVIAWEGPDGILMCGMEYLVNTVREGRRVQEFTMKYRNGHRVKDRDHGVIWWEVGSPFIKRQKAAMK
jgi:hypothetical protein